MPKAKSARGRRDADRSLRRRRGGATLRIREECVRFFCETLRALFLVERNGAPRDSGLTSVFYNFSNDSKMVHGQLTPPPVESPTRGNDGITTDGDNYPAGSVASWLEIWDYAGGASFRAFVTKEAIEEGTEKTLFVFFDASALGRDLKHALVALIELAEGPLECAYMVIAIDRFIPESDAEKLTKGLQWAGFSLVTLDFWTGGLDVTSSRWLLMGMEM